MYATKEFHTLFTELSMDIQTIFLLSTSSEVSWCILSYRIPHVEHNAIVSHLLHDKTRLLSSDIISS